MVPDALVGKCWPAVFAAVGSADTDACIPVIEGLLNLVHLDHAARLLGPLPKTTTSLRITATVGIVTDTDIGRVLPVSVTIADASGTVLARLQERFAIRGRTGTNELEGPARAGAARVRQSRSTLRAGAGATSN